MNRTQTILSGLLLVQLLLIVLIRSPFASTSGPAQSQPLLPSLEAITPSHIELIGSDDERINLRNEGGGWVVSEAGDFPADQTKIDNLVKELRELSVRRPVVSSSRYHEAFKVRTDDNEGRVRVWDDASGDPQIDLILGTSPNYRITHVRRADDDRVYEVRDLASYDVRAKASAWSVKQLVDVPQEDVVEIAVTNASGSFRLARQDEGGWKIVEPQAQAGRELDADKVDSLLRAACSLSMDEPVGRRDEDAQGLSEPAARVELLVRGTGEDASSELVEVVVGRAVDGKDTQRYVTRSGFDFTGTIWESSVKKLLDEPVDDLLAS